MNEFGIGIISYHLFFFTDWVQDQAVQSNYGWSMVSMISLFTAFNISLVIYFGGRGIWLLLVKLYLRLKQKLNPGLNYLESRLEPYRKIEIEVAEEIQPPKTLDELIAQKNEEYSRKRIRVPIN